jgi:protein PhnA
MKPADQIIARSNGLCELCQSNQNTGIYELPPDEGKSVDSMVLICEKCQLQIEKKETLDLLHWSCLSNSMWSEVPALQVLSWRLLNRCREQSWAADLLDMMYLDETQLAWAKATGDHENDSSVDLHQDSNGHVLQNGDAVVLVKSLDVKGSTLNAKMGTVVRNIRLVANNTEQIEGKIEGQQIVILTKYVRKQHAGPQA